MPGGEMSMIVEGNQNVILNGNPTKTFFTSVYKKYFNGVLYECSIMMTSPLSNSWPFKMFQMKMISDDEDV